VASILLAKQRKLGTFINMGRKYKFHENDLLYFVSFATVQWIDVFTRRLYYDIIVDSLKYCIENKGLE
jgi:putative transposase